MLNQVRKRKKKWREVSQFDKWIRYTPPSFLKTIIIDRNGISLMTAYKAFLLTCNF